MLATVHVVKPRHLIGSCGGSLRTCRTSPRAWPCISIFEAEALIGYDKERRRRIVDTKNGSAMTVMRLRAAEVSSKTEAGQERTEAKESIPSSSVHTFTCVLGPICPSALLSSLASLLSHFSRSKYARHGEPRPLSSQGALQQPRGACSSVKHVPSSFKVVP